MGRNKILRGENVSPDICLLPTLHQVPVVCALQTEVSRSSVSPSLGAFG